MLIIATHTCIVALTTMELTTESITSQELTTSQVTSAAITSSSSPITPSNSSSPTTTFEHVFVAMDTSSEGQIGEDGNVGEWDGRGNDGECREREDREREREEESVGMRWTGTIVLPRVPPVLAIGSE